MPPATLFSLPSTRTLPGSASARPADAPAPSGTVAGADDFRLAFDTGSKADAPGTPAPKPAGLAMEMAEAPTGAEGGDEGEGADALEWLADFLNAISGQDGSGAAAGAGPVPAWPAPPVAPSAVGTHVAAAVPAGDGLAVGPGAARPSDPPDPGVSDPSSSDAPPAALRTVLTPASPTALPPDKPGPAAVPTAGGRRHVAGPDAGPMPREMRDDGNRPAIVTPVVQNGAFGRLDPGSATTPSGPGMTNVEASPAMAAGAGAVSVPPGLPDAPRSEGTQPLTLPQLRDGVSQEVRALVDSARAEVSTRRQRDGSLTTELELAPAELGRLRLVLHTGERGLHLSVIVDRPESLEAVRRQLDGFHRSLLADGVTLDGLDVGTGTGGGERGPPRDAHPEARPVPGAANRARTDVAPTPPPAPRASARGRLDIRL